MDERLKQRLVGAAVLVLAAVVFVPMLLDQGGGGSQPPTGIIPQQPPEFVSPPLPADATARTVPLDSNRSATAPAPAARPAPPVEQPATKTVTRPAPVAPAPRESGMKSGFAVQVGSFSKVDNARGLRDKLVARGYTAMAKTSGSVTRVYVGPQSSRAEAEKVLKKLLADFELKGIVVNFSG